MFPRPGFSDMRPARTDPALPRAKKIKVEMDNMTASQKRSISKSTTRSGTQTNKNCFDTYCCLFPSWTRYVFVPFTAIACFAVSGGKAIRITKFVATTTTTAITTSAITFLSAQYLNPLNSEAPECHQDPNTPLSLEKQKYEAYNSWYNKYKLAGQNG